MRRWSDCSGLDACMERKTGFSWKEPENMKHIPDRAKVREGDKKDCRYLQKSYYAGSYPALVRSSSSPLHAFRLLLPGETGGADPR